MRYVKLISILFVIVGFASGCAGTSGLNENDSIVEVRSFEDDAVTATLNEVENQRTLYVFDIDNTLLKHPEGQFFGTDQWYDWQKTLTDGSPQKVECKLQMQGAAYYMAHMEPTEAGLSVSLVERLQGSNKPVIAFTARSPEFRYATERELAKSGFDFSDSLPGDLIGIPGYYSPDPAPGLENPRPASYQNGIAMLAGQSKGPMLADLIRRVGAENSFDTIVFFDDKQKNVDSVLKTFQDDRRGARIFWYQNVDTTHSEEDIENAVAGQRELSEAYGFFRRRGGCDK